MAAPCRLLSGCCLLLSLFAVVSSVPVASGTQKRLRDASNGRLPRDVEPFHYDLELQPDIYTGAPPFFFDGYVEIFIRALQVTNEIVLNQRRLNIVGINIGVDPNTPVGSPSPILLNWSADNTTEFLTLGVANSLVIGAQYFLKIYFKGQLGSSGDGLYYDSYVDTDGSTKYLAATQMESIEARAAFPCFDEPDLKATYNITIVSKPPSITLSNMNELRTEDRTGGWTAHIFAKSPIMSTYQVCTCVGDFIYLESEWQGITTYPVRIYARPQMSGKLGFAASIAAKLQAWLEKETNISYQLPKMGRISSIIV
jgi:aminopeptidase N